MHASLFYVVTCAAPPRLIGTLCPLMFRVDTISVKDHRCIWRPVKRTQEIKKMGVAFVLVITVKVAMAAVAVVAFQ